jgi:acyl-CoA synthetase (AMP-forming)/AMP-acid ligase II
MALDSVYQTFCATAARWSDRPFFHVPASVAKGYSDTAIDWTYADALLQVNHLIGGYSAAGLMPGHRVALLLGNRADFFLHYLALNALGVSIVPLNGEATPAELVHILRDSQALLIVALAEYRDALEQVISGLNVAPSCAWVGETDVATLQIEGVQGAGEGEAALLYTSGSTGDPKGCMIPNSYMLRMGRWYLNVGGLCAVTDGQERLITPLPLVHMNALAASGMAMIMSGGCIVQLDRFHPSSWWQTVRDSGATIVHYLGVMPAMLLQAPPSAQDRSHQVKFGFGAGIHPKHHASFEERFGFPLIESWSMTEVGGGAAIIAQGEPRHIGTRCFGTPQPFMQFRIVDESGDDVAEGLPGELWVRASGPDPRAGFFCGYANQPALTEAVWEQGYFHTGDIVRAGTDGSLHFVDRKKSIIRRSGENIASLDVEGVLGQLAMVKGVGVGPVDDELRGEEVIACIELVGGFEPNDATASAIFEAASEHLAYFKLPGFIAFVPRLPLTPSQKLQRGVLKTIARSLVDSHQAFDLRNRKRRPPKKQAV